jgi:hypothetical protein
MSILVADLVFAQSRNPVGQDYRKRITNLSYNNPGQLCHNAADIIAGHWFPEHVDRIIPMFTRIATSSPEKERFVLFYCIVFAEVRAECPAVSTNSSNPGVSRSRKGV